MDNKLFDQFAEGLLNEQAARPIVIIGAARVDTLLLEVLRSFFLPKISGGKNCDEILERDPGPLGTFSSRIKMCRRLGLIDPTFYAALEKLRLLRNLSAHQVLFDDTKSPVQEHLVDLRTSMATRKSYRLIKERYFEQGPLGRVDEWQCLLLTMCALLEAVREKIRQTTGNKKAMRISAD